MSAMPRIWLFIILTALLSLPGYWLFAHPDVLPGHRSSAVLMWAPGVAGLLTLWLTNGTLRSIGWRLDHPRYLLAALAIPLVCAFPIYLIVWTVGMASFDASRWQGALPYGLTASGPLSAAGLLISVGLLDTLSRALGEEIGWRGVLAPALARVTTPINAGLISGTVWAVWHVPIIVNGTYHADGVPLPLQTLFFFVAVVAFGMVMAWLRFASGSIWPAVLAHGFWNLVVQSLFDRATVDRGHASWWTGEFGAGVPILFAALLLVIWPRLRGLRTTA